MAGKLIMLPLRVWLRSACLLTRAAGGAAERAASLAGQTIGVTSPNGSDRGRPPATATPEPGWREEAIEEPVSPADVEHPEPVDVEHPEPVDVEHPEPVDVEHPEPVDVEHPEPVSPIDVEHPRHAPEWPPAREPVHVSEEPELVREVAEPGAEEGAGASVTVLEPWSGYAHMNAREVIARAGQASPAELAAVRLYESRHRSRQTVLAAVDRQLKLSGGSALA